MNSPGTGGVSAGSGGTGAVANAGGNAADPPLSDPRLDALGTTDEQLESSSGAELVNLVGEIGHAYGHALCSCLAPELPGESCAAAENGFRWLANEMQRRCVTERSEDIPGFEEYLRCRAKAVRDVGQPYAECPAEEDIRFTNRDSCDDTSLGVEVSWLFHVCFNAYYCDDGTFHESGRCNGVQDCPTTLDDERDCQLHEGTISVRCGETVTTVSSVCEPGVCEELHEQGLCAANDVSYNFTCRDGTPMAASSLCRGLHRCPDGEDDFEGIDGVECL